MDAGCQSADAHQLRRDLGLLVCVVRRLLTFSFRVRCGFLRGGSLRFSGRFLIGGSDRCFFSRHAQLLAQAVDLHVDLGQLVLTRGKLGLRLGQGSVGCVEIGLHGAALRSQFVDLGGQALALGLQGLDLGLGIGQSLVLLLQVGVQRHAVGLNGKKLAFQRVNLVAGDLQRLRDLLVVLADGGHRCKEGAQLDRPALAAVDYCRFFCNKWFFDGDRFFFGDGRFLRCDGSVFFEQLCAVLRGCHFCLNDLLFDFAGGRRRQHGSQLVVQRRQLHLQIVQLGIPLADGVFSRGDSQLGGLDVGFQSLDAGSQIHRGVSFIFAYHLRLQQGLLFGQLGLQIGQFPLALG